MLKILQRIRLNRPIITCFHNHSRNFSASNSLKNSDYNVVPIKKSINRSNDVLFQNIRASIDALDLFDLISNNDSEMLSSSHVIQSLRSLYNLQKTGNTTLQTTEIIKHPAFEKLCHSLRRHSRSLDVSDIIECVKFLSLLGVRTDSQIMVILLNLIRHQINDIELNQIVFLEFLLKKFETTPLIEALQMALPALFQINLSTKIDHENVVQLTDYIAFASKNNINDKCTMNIVSALTLHGNKITGDQACNVIWSLAEMKNYQPAYEKLLSNSYSALLREIKTIPFNQLETTMHKVIQRIINNVSDFYNEDFMNACANQVIEDDLGFQKSIYIFKKLNKITFINIPLLDYVAKKVEEDPTNLVDCRFTTLYSFVTAFSTANYSSQNWSKITEYIFQNSIFQSCKNELPWMRFCLELVSLNCFSSQLIEKIFQTEFLEKHLARDNNFLDYIQMLSLYHCSKCLMKEYTVRSPDQVFLDKAIEMNISRDIFPLKLLLELGCYGKEYVLTKVVTNYGQVIDHVIVMRDGEPLNLGDFSGTLEDLQKQYEGAKIIAVLGYTNSHYAINVKRLRGIFTLRQRCLEAHGIKVLLINISELDAMPDREKIPFIFQEIKYALKD